MSLLSRKVTGREQEAQDLLGESRDLRLVRPKNLAILAQARHPVVRRRRKGARRGFSGRRQVQSPRPMLPPNAGTDSMAVGGGVEATRLTGRGGDGA